MKYFVGIDLHSDNCFIGMSDLDTVMEPMIFWGG